MGFALVSMIAFVGYLAGIVCYWFIRTFLYEVKSTYFYK